MIAPVASFLVFHLRTTIYTSMVGTCKAVPVILTKSEVIILISALMTPVEEEMMLPEAEWSPLQYLQDLKSPTT